MNKLENLLEAAKLNELVGRKIEEEKKNNKLAKKAIRKVFENRYQSGKNKWFFSRLRF